MKKLILALVVICTLTFALPAYAANGGIGVYLDGERQATEARADNGRTLLPIRAICNMLDLKIDYEAPTKKVLVYVDNDIYTFTLNSKQVLCNGKAVKALDTVPYLYQERTYLPVRYVAELTSTDISWNRQKRAVEINRPYKLTVKYGVLEQYIGPRPTGDDRILDLSCRTDITEIGESAFASSGVTEVLLPKSLIKIGRSAFNAGSLKNISIPDSVSSIGAYTFSSCRALQTIHLPNELQDLQSELFVDSGIKELVVPAKVKTIGANIFALSSADKPVIRTVVLPPSVTKIHEAAFAHCDNLTIQSLAGSYAETYAKTHNIKFTAITEAELSKKLADR